MKKRFVSFICILVFILTAFPNSAFADGNNSQEGNLLVNSQISDDMFFDNQDENGSFVNEHDEESPALSLSVSTAKSGINTLVAVNYEWNKLPFNRYQDPIYVVWDEDVFYLKDDSVRKADKFEKFSHGKFGSYDENIHSDEKSFAMIGFSSAKWFADLKGHTACVSRLYGSGEFTLVPKKVGVETEIKAVYVHDKMLGVNFFGKEIISSYDMYSAKISVTS